MISHPASLLHAQPLLPTDWCDTKEVRLDISEIAAKMQKGLSKRAFDGSVKFDCGTDGVIVLADSTVSRDDRDTACTIGISTGNLAKLISGKLNPMTGVMMGKLKVSGDVATAMKLGALLKS